MSERTSTSVVDALSTMPIAELRKAENEIRARLELARAELVLVEQEIKRREASDDYLKERLER